MKSYVTRYLELDVRASLGQFPVVAILGARQCGKSTLAKRIVADDSDAVYLDLEIPSHLNRLSDAESFLRMNNDRLICVDEIQRKPDLFPVIRGICDMTRRPGQILLLGSASPQLLKQRSESLAGRIAYLDLTPFLIHEIDQSKYRDHWLRGGFPDSYLANDEKASRIWRQNFIRTYLEQDIPALGFNVSTQTVRRLWTMLAHISGSVINYSKLAQSLGVSAPTVKSYIDILEKTYMVRVLQPCFTNVKKRLVKSPKIYLRDTGVMHNLLDVESMNSLFGNPTYGGSWESYALEQICSVLNGWAPSFYRTAKGAEIDLVLEKDGRRIAVEFKASSAPVVTRGFYQALEDLDIEQAFVVAPLPEEISYPFKKKTLVTTISGIIEQLCG
ncbi:ATP-binding protein [Verrucomicrobiota bacterium]